AKRFTRPLVAPNLRDDDEVVNVSQSDGDKQIIVATNTGYGLWYDASEVNAVGQRALGVIAIQLREYEHFVTGHILSEEKTPFLVIVTQRGACKRMRLSEVTKSTRAKRGLVMLRELKGNPHRIRGFFLTNEEDHVCLQTIYYE